MRLRLQGTIELSSVLEMTAIVKCLTAVSRKVDNIPLIGSMAFVAQLTQTVTLLLQHLLQMESSFFKPTPQKKRQSSKGIFDKTF